MKPLQRENDMNQRKKIFGSLLWIMIGLVLVPGVVHSEIDWRIVKQIDLKAPPVDVAASEDGKMIFVLTLNDIAVYSLAKNMIVNRIPVDEKFDRIKYYQKNKLLVLTGSSSKTLKIIRVDQIYDIDISGLPFKGPAKAPVTIAVFDDYQ
jgi:hypothetical protein